MTQAPETPETPETEIELKAVTWPDDWPAAREIRRRVFVVEQDCPPDEEFDGHDPQCRHVLAGIYGKAVGTARWRPVLDEGQVAAKLERFAVLSQARGKGVGEALVTWLLDDARSAGFRRFLIHSQTRWTDFYGAFGFRPQGESFPEAGIPHVKMRYEDPDSD